MSGATPVINATRRPHRHKRVFITGKILLLARYKDISDAQIEMLRLFSGETLPTVGYRPGRQTNSPAVGAPSAVDNWPAGDSNTGYAAQYRQMQ